MIARACARKLTVKVSWIAGFACVVLSRPEPALACDAPPDAPRDPARRLREFDVVARGTVTSFSTWTPQTKHGWQPGRITSWMVALLGYDARVVIQVDEAWKGVELDELVVHDDGIDTCCGMRAVEVGDEVLVYAREYDGMSWIDGWCVPIIPIADAEPDLDYLGPGRRELRSRWWRDLSGWGLVVVPMLFGVGLRRRTVRG